jgi:hypothetical protein
MLWGKKKVQKSLVVSQYSDQCKGLWNHKLTRGVRKCWYHQQIFLAEICLPVTRWSQVDGLCEFRQTKVWLYKELKVSGVLKFVQLSYNEDVWSHYAGASSNTRESESMVHRTTALEERAYLVTITISRVRLLRRKLMVIRHPRSWIGRRIC